MLQQAWVDRWIAFGLIQFLANQTHVRTAEHAQERELVNTRVPAQLMYSVIIVNKVIWNETKRLRTSTSYVRFLNPCAFILAPCAVGNNPCVSGTCSGVAPVGGQPATATCNCDAGFFGDNCDNSNFSNFTYSTSFAWRDLDPVQVKFLCQVDYICA